MSIKQRLSGHLEDYSLLIGQLLASVSQYNGSPDQIYEVANKILRKDQLLQQAVDTLCSRQRILEETEKLHAKIKAADDLIVGFGKKLGSLEQQLHDAVTDPITLANNNAPEKKQTFNVREVTLFAEKLGLMSFAPADYIEKKGMSASSRQPPAPQEVHIAASRLHMSIDELSELHEENKRLSSLQKSLQSTTSSSFGQAPKYSIPSLQQLLQTDSKTPVAAPSAESEVNDLRALAQSLGVQAPTLGKSSETGGPKQEKEDVVLASGWDSDGDMSISSIDGDDDVDDDDDW